MATRSFGFAGWDGGLDNASPENAWSGSRELKEDGCCRRDNK